MKDKIKWRKPDYKNKWGRVSDKEMDDLCIRGITSTGDIRIEKDIYGKKVTYTIFRVEKEGELIRGLETLNRPQLIQEIKELEKELKQKNEARRSIVE